MVGLISRLARGSLQKPRPPKDFELRSQSWRSCVKLRVEEQHVGLGGLLLVRPTQLVGWER